MSLGRRVRGLVGSALMWGTVGAGIGTLMFLARAQPWRSQATLGSLAPLFLGFAGSGFLWASVCGLAFGAALIALGARKGRALSARGLTMWGALGGAAFPLLLYTPVVLSRGAYGSIPFYGMLTGISTLFGALCGRAIYALATRGRDGADGLDAPDTTDLLAEPRSVVEMSLSAESRVRV